MVQDLHCSDFPVAHGGQFHWSQPGREMVDCGQLMYAHIVLSFLLIFSEGKTLEASLQNAVDSSRC